MVKKLSEYLSVGSLKVLIENHSKYYSKIIVLNGTSPFWKQVQFILELIIARKFLLDYRLSSGN